MTGSWCRHSLPISGSKAFCGRRDAQLVSSHLDKVLPEGALAAKYRLAAGSADEVIQLYNHVRNVRGDFKVVDVSLRECARIVSANCLDRARAIDKVCSPRADMHSTLCFGMCRQARFVCNDALMCCWSTGSQEGSRWLKVP